MKDPLNIDIEMFATELFSGVDSLVKSGRLEVRRGEDTLWTDAIKLWLDEESQKYEAVRPLYCDRKGASEFLLDFVWWKNAPGERAVLACESELGNTRRPELNAGLVAEDFDKLLSFKAPVKLMIFDSRSGANDDDSKQVLVIQELNRYLRRYGDHRKNEQYLVIDVAKKRGAWFCKIKSEGENSSMLLEPLTF